jgi:dTDP-glucose 4,6-dehydratase/UDP-glucose 4-epimerase
MDFKNKKVLITGGLGFIGSNLAKALILNGAKVTLVDSLNENYGGNLFNVENFKNNLTINISDVRDEHSLQKLLVDQDYLFNLAGQTSHLDSMINPKVDVDINTVSQISILEVCRKFNPSIKIVFASTRQIYGRPQYLPVDEYHPIKPVDVNGINKWSGEAYHSLYYEVYGIRSCSLRLTNTYGPNMRIKDARQTFLGIWFKNLIQGIPLSVYGDGAQLRDFNYVDDVVKAMLMCAKSDYADGQIFNLGGQEVVSLKELASKMIQFVDGAKYEIIEFPEDRRKIDIGDYYSDYTKIKNIVGWTPHTDLVSGLTKTYQYFALNMEHYLK